MQTPGGRPHGIWVVVDGLAKLGAPLDVSRVAYVPNGRIGLHAHIPIYACALSLSLSLYFVSRISVYLVIEQQPFKYIM